VREVLTDAAAILEHFHQRRGDCRFTGRIAKVAVQLSHQLFSAGEDGPAPGKTIGGVFVELPFDAHVRGFVSKAARFEAVSPRTRAAVVELDSRALPRKAVFGIHRGARMDFNLHVGGDFEPAMRMIELDAGDEIAEGVDFVPLAIERGSHVDHVLLALLIRGWPWNKVQQLMRMDHIVAVRISGFVANAVADGHVAKA